MVTLLPPFPKLALVAQPTSATAVRTSNDARKSIARVKVDMVRRKN